MFHPKVILRIIGLLLEIEALFMISSIAVSLYYNDGMLKPFIYTFAIMVVCGLSLTY